MPSTDRPIRAAILSSGTEILQGNYPDTNAQFLSSELTALGYAVTVISAAPDDEEAIVETLRTLFGRADFIITTGGLGPTEDDNIREAVARLWQVPLQFDPHAWDMIGQRLKNRYRVLPESNRRQAMLPASCEPIYNNYGTAPGFFMPANESASAAIITLPGPPREMKPVFRESIIPLLKRAFPSPVHQSILQIHTAGRSEGDINECIKDLFGARPDVTVALLASGGLVRVRLTLRAENEAGLASLRQEMTEEVHRRIGLDDIWGEDDDTLEGVLGRILTERKMTVAVAESCTGGMINAALTRIAGSSAYLKSGYVVYSNEAKTRLLGVRESTLQAHGAVSAETAIEMAQGALNEAGADIAGAVTGIAGPGGGSEEKPVGLVWFGVAARDGRPTEARRVQFPGERDLVRNFSTVRCMDLIRRRLLRSSQP